MAALAGRGDAGAPDGALRVDVVSDTHGHLSRELEEAVRGCDLLVHAGDICSEADLEELRALVPEVKAVLGNNDYGYDYGPGVAPVAVFTYGGLRFSVSHYRHMLPVSTSDVAICGHTHVAKVEQAGPCLVMNPGSASYPRGSRGPTIGRLLVRDGKVLSARIVDL